MLPTFVIGLREGLEAALIVGIVAAFLRQRGRRDLLRWAFAGVGASVLLCLAVGVLLHVLSQNMPQRQQEGLETVIGAVAVGMVTYMVVWMRRHSRDLKGQLEGAAADAIAAGSGWALVAMAFLAVLREGFETVVFLLAAFNESDTGASAGGGALLGILVAVGLGYGIYRGGVRINLSKFFRATGAVLVLVAAGLVVNALHTAHEAGWLSIGQQATVDLSAVLRPGSVQASLLTGMLGVQQHPVLIEVVGWLLYLVPVGVYVVWPPGRGLARAAVARVALAGAAVLAVTAIVLALVLPDRPGGDAVLSGGGVRAGVVSRWGDTALIAASGPGTGTEQVRATRTGVETHDGLPADVYTAARSGDGSAGRPASIGWDEVARRNGGRLPLGAHPAGGGVPVSYAERDEATFWVEPRTGRMLDVRWRETVTMIARLPIGALGLGVVSSTSTAAPGSAVQAAVRAARADVTSLDRHRLLSATAVAAGVVAGLLLLSGLALIARSAAPEPRKASPTSASELASS